MTFVLGLAGSLTFSRETLAAPSTGTPRRIIQPESNLSRNGKDETDVWVASRLIRKTTKYVGFGYLVGPHGSGTSASIPAIQFEIQKLQAHEASQALGLFLGLTDIWGAHWDQSHYCCEGAYSEFYWGYGLGTHWRVANQLSALVDIESYHIRARIGVEDLFRSRRQWRAEGVLTAGPRGIGLEAVIAYAL